MAKKCKAQNCLLNNKIWTLKRFITAQWNKNWWKFGRYKRRYVLYVTFIRIFAKWVLSYPSLKREESPNKWNVQFFAAINWLSIRRVVIRRPMPNPFGGRRSSLRRRESVAAAAAADDDAEHPLRDDRPSRKPEEPKSGELRNRKWISFGQSTEIERRNHFRRKFVRSGQLSHFAPQLKMSLQGYSTFFFI